MPHNKSEEIKELRKAAKQLSAAWNKLVGEEAAGLEFVIGESGGYVSIYMAYVAPEAETGMTVLSEKLGFKL